MDKPRLALVLGSGSARGWAHIGVIKALEAMDVRPDVVCGASIGALVGAAYVSDQLKELEEWIVKLDWWDIVRLMDLKLAGGFIEGESLMKHFRKHLSDKDIEELDIKFGVVATNLRNGQELWLQSGSLLDAVRASIALPGLFNPYLLDDQLVVDGGLVNPVPVSLARAMGADRIIAVNLNGDIVGRHLVHRGSKSEEASPTGNELFDKLFRQISSELKAKFEGVYDKEHKMTTPGLFDVIASSINIMQDRITRSRMAGDPPDLILAPRLARIGLLEFDRAEEAIKLGEEVVKEQEKSIESLIAD